MDFFHRGEGPSQSKSFGALFVHQQFWNFGQKMEGVDQIQKFLGTFYPDFGEIRPKKCPKSSKNLGGGGQTFLVEVHN